MDSGNQLLYEDMLFLALPLLLFSQDMVSQNLDSSMTVLYIRTRLTKIQKISFSFLSFIFFYRGNLLVWNLENLPGQQHHHRGPNAREQGGTEARRIAPRRTRGPHPRKAPSAPDKPPGSSGNPPTPGMCQGLRREPHPT